MSFPDFIATRQTVSWTDFLSSQVARECCVESDWFQPGEIKEVLLYEAQYFIFSLTGGGYTITLDRSMITSSYLERLEVMLYLETSDDSLSWSY